MKLVSLILAIHLVFAYDGINMFFLKVIKAVEDCQSTILKNNPDFKNSAIKIPTLHITLFAMHLKDINQIEVLLSFYYCFNFETVKHFQF